jgi:hypothetical protein
LPKTTGQRRSDDGFKVVGRAHQPFKIYGCMFSLGRSGGLHYNHLLAINLVVKSSSKSSMQVKDGRNSGKVV